jgi:hypothetical protein
VTEYWDGAKFPLKEVKNFKSVIENIQDELEELEPKTSEISTYSTDTSYSVGDICLYEGQIYICTSATDEGSEFDANNWTAMTELEDNSIYYISSNTNFVLPQIPQAQNNREGITIYITALDAISISFQTEPTWFAEEPSMDLVNGKKIVLFILDGIVGFNQIV